MGKGDKKSRRGKIVNNSYGKRRPRKKQTIAISIVKEDKPKAKKVQEEVKTEKPKVIAKKTIKSATEYTTPKAKSTKKAV